MAKTSAAKRLNTFVNRLIGVPVTQTSRVGTAFAAVLGIEPTDHLALGEAYSSFLLLIRDAIAEVEAKYGPPSSDPDVEEARTLRLTPLNQLYGNFANNSIHSTIDIINGNVTPRLLDGLAHTAATVQEVAREEKLEDSQLLKILEQIADVKKSVSSSDLDPSLKFLLLGLLSEVEKAIAQYELSGVAGIGSAIERMVGAMVTRTSLLKKAGTGIKVLRDVWFVVTVVTKLVNWATHSNQMELPPALEEMVVPSVGPASGVPQFPADPTAIPSGVALPERRLAGIGDHKEEKESHP